MNKFALFCLLFNLSLSGFLLSEAFSIDFRYPDKIVDPRPVCPHEGFFPHPRNCSWFYRCHSHEYSTQYYHTDYFECAPGTVFSAVHKVCIKGRWKDCTPFDCALACKPTTKNCFTFTFCEDNHTDQTTRKLCHESIYKCNNCPETYGNHACLSGEMFLHPESSLVNGSSLKIFAPPMDEYPSRCLPLLDEMTCTNLNTTSLPSSPPSCNKCFLEMTACNRHVVCPYNSMDEMELQLCHVAIKRCFPCNSMQNICSNGKVFSTQYQTCFGPPDSDGMKCSSNTGTTVITTEPTPTTTYYTDFTTDSPPLETTTHPVDSTTTTEVDLTTTTEADITTSSPQCQDCFLNVDGCLQDITICPNNGDPVIATVCSFAENMCLDCDLKHSMCPLGKHFSVFDESCIDPPDSPSQVCPSAAKCSHEITMIKEPWIEAMYCKDYPSCYDLRDRESLKLCSRYYTCDYSPRTGKFTVDWRTCTKPGQLFDYERDECIDDPNNECDERHEPNMAEVLCSHHPSWAKATNRLRSRFCKKYPLCIDGTFTETVQLCSKYLDCKVHAKKTTLKHSKCVDKQLFSFETKTCEDYTNKICPKLKFRRPSELRP